MPANITDGYIRFLIKDPDLISELDAVDAHNEKVYESRLKLLRKMARHLECRYDEDQPMPIRFKQVRLLLRIHPRVNISAQEESALVTKKLDKLRTRIEADNSECRGNRKQWKYSTSCCDNGEVGVYLTFMAGNKWIPALHAESFKTHSEVAEEYLKGKMDAFTCLRSKI